MQYNTDRIRTTHVGRLPPPKGFEDTPARLANGEVMGEAELRAKVVPAIAGIVRRQVETGIDIVGDGEFWTTRSFQHYATHFEGLAVRPLAAGETASSRETTRERDAFPEFYAAMDHAKKLFFVPGERPMPVLQERVVVCGPLKSKGPQAIEREIATFKAAISAAGVPVGEAFLPVLAPGWLDHFIYNEFYKTEEEFLG
ncbi:MAG: hypothetical protein ACREFQ_08375, partial [Stellaceae bacterium]